MNGIINELLCKHSNVTWQVIRFYKVFNKFNKYNVIIF